MAALLIPDHALEVLTDPDALEEFLLEAGGLVPRDAERVTDVLTRLINETS